MTPTPLCKCRVLYIGSSVPTVTELSKSVMTPSADGVRDAHSADTAAISFAVGGAKSASRSGTSSMDA